MPKAPLDPVHESATRVDAPFAKVRSLLLAEADRHGLTVHERETGLGLSVGRASIDLIRHSDRSDIVIRAASDAALFALRAEVSHHLAPVLGPLDWSGVRLGLPPNLTRLRVGQVRRVSPSYLRLRLLGDVGRFRTGPLHARLIAPGGGTGRWPRVTATGKTEWPDGSALPHRPVYTILRSGEDWLDIDIFDHPAGRTRDWVLNLRPGDAVGLMGPGGSGVPVADRLALFGDETALPAISRIIHEADASVVGTATVLVPSPADRRDLERGNFRVSWLFRSEGRMLTDCLRSTLTRPDPGFVWFASGRADCDAARRLVTAQGLGKSRYRIASYWTYGAR